MVESIQKVISVKGLSKAFGSHVAVKNVSLDVHKGEVFGLLGPNGAGKTTLISMLSGIIKPDSGSANLIGYDVKKDIRRIKSKVSVVPQDLALYMELTGYDNLSFLANLYGLKGKLKKERIYQALEIAQLHDVAKKKVGTYSGGMKRRLNLAGGLLNHPEVIFLDEPTVGVDPQSRNHIFDSINHLVHELNMSVVYTTHYMEEAETLCDRVAIYDQGEILDIDDTSALITKHGEKKLEIQVDRVDHNVIEKIKNIPNVDYVNVVNNAIYIQSTSIVETTEKVLGLVRKENIEVNKFNVKESDLEDVFLKLTGKKLRD